MATGSSIKTARNATIVHNGTPQRKLLKLFADSKAIVNVTRLDSARIPEVVEANLRTVATAFSAPQVRVLRGGFTGLNLRTIGLDNLEETGLLDVPRVTHLNLGKLRRADVVVATEAETINMPYCTEYKSVAAPKAKHVAIPNRDSLYAPSADTDTAGVTRPAVAPYLQRRNPPTVA